MWIMCCITCVIRVLKSLDQSEERFWMLSTSKMASKWCSESAGLVNCSLCGVQSIQYQAGSSPLVEQLFH